MEPQKEIHQFLAASNQVAHVLLVTITFELLADHTPFLHQELSREVSKDWNTHAKHAQRFLDELFNLRRIVVLLAAPPPSRNSPLTRFTSELNELLTDFEECVVQKLHVAAQKDLERKSDDIRKIQDAYANLKKKARRVHQEAVVFRNELLTTYINPTALKPLEANG